MAAISSAECGLSVDGVLRVPLKTAATAPAVVIGTRVGARLVLHPRKSERANDTVNRRHKTRFTI
ncbi:MAG: hypothetical protein ACK5L0_00805 [Candidatus Fimivivens sp.]